MVVFNPLAVYSNRTVTLYCILTCIYLPLCLLYYCYSDGIYSVGKFENISLILIITSVEVLKFSLNGFFADSCIIKDTKSAKMKKYYLKLKLKEIFKCIYLLIGATGVFYVLAVLFGAPMLTECEETLMFSILLSVLSVFPSCLHLGADNTVSLLTGTRLPVENISDLMLKNMRITVLGAWLGAVVIPLDWDRPWQVWPIPCMTGAILGYVSSHLSVLVKSIPVPSFITKIYSK